MKELDTDIIPTKVTVPIRPYHGPICVNSDGSITQGDVNTPTWTINLDLSLGGNDWLPPACFRTKYYPAWHILKGLKEARKHPR